MSPRARLVTSVLACLPVLRAGDALLTIGEDTPVFVTASATVRHDDNINLSAGDRIQATVFVLTPGIEIEREGARTSGSLVVQHQIVRYDRAEELDTELLNVDARLSYDGGVSRLAARASYRELDQSNLGLSSIEQSVRRDQTSVGLDADVNLTAKTALGAGVGFDKTQYPTTGYADSEGWSIPVDAYYSVRPKLDLSAGYRFGTTKVEGPGGDSKAHFINVGARGEFTPKLQGQVRVGYTVRNPDLGDTTGLLGLQANLQYELSPKAGLDLTASRDFATSAFGGGQEVTSIRLGGSFAFSEQWQANAGLSYEMTDYLGSVREDDFTVFDAAAVYLVNRMVSVQAAYVFRHNDSTLDPLTFSNNVFSLSSGVKF